jgi:hypothetical protein
MGELMAEELDLPGDVLAWVGHAYGERAGVVLKGLRAFRVNCASVATDRVLRCIAFLGDGDADRVQKYVDLAKRDWRDVVTAAEYQYPNARVRDFSKPLGF